MRTGKQIDFRKDKEFYMDLKHLCVNLGTSVQQALNEAIRTWYEQKLKERDELNILPSADEINKELLPL